VHEISEAHTVPRIHPFSHTGRRTMNTVFFDLDGTLADTAPDLAHALNQLRAEQGLKPLPFQRIRSHISQGAAAMIRLAFGADQDEATFELLRTRFLEIYGANLCVHTHLFPGMDEVLSQIEQNGMKWGIVTNKRAWMTVPLVEALGLVQRAACIVSGDSTDRRKPHPQPLFHACELIGSAPEHSFYVGDDHRDIKAGNAAGMTTLVARYGYIHDDDIPEDWGADGIIDEIQDLLKWFERVPVPGI
jgi:2-phosphoglycolate phosphatase